MGTASLVNELLKQKKFLSAIEVAELASAANPGYALFGEILDDVVERTRRAAIVRKFIGASRLDTGDVQQLKLDLIQHSEHIRRHSEDGSYKAEIRAAFDRLRTAPLVCGSRTGTGQSDEVIEGGTRASGDNAPAQGDPASPLVSVVTVCFNAVDGIEAALESVQSQSYPNIEHIVIDGASTDGTVDILRQHDDRLAYFLSEPDNGIYAAMNKGLRRARGEYVVLLNADDRLTREFVSKSLVSLTESGADISFCDYETEEGKVSVLYPGVGILLSQLNIKHNTFLCHRRCFEVVGGFDERRKIVSDARWNRAAYLSGLKFVKADGALMFYSTQGASSSQTAAMKSRVIRESSCLLRLCFPFLDSREAEGIYRSNFNLHFLRGMAKLYVRPGVPRLFREALREFMVFNLCERDVYRLNVRRPDQVAALIDLSSTMNLPLSLFRSRREPCALRHLLTKIEMIERKAKIRRQRVVLHFARVFSSPSETFIHEFLGDLRECDDQSLHVMLCDERRLKRERPYDDVLAIPWRRLPRSLRNTLYALLWKRLNPRMIVAHFALNGYWLYQRLTDEQRRAPSIFMCHGVDVFAVAREGDYADFMMSTAMFASNIHLTAVSGFLRNELIKQGFPEWKVHDLPNGVSDRFFKHRKSDGFYRGGRPLEVVTIGRLIKWKGHQHLVRAIADVIHRDGIPARLTIVYGHFDQELESLQVLARQLDIDDAITWEPFVDFNAQPDYLAAFDLFVLPSTFSDSTGAQTETFGVSMLEAICAGLAVIGSNAGGIPEVVGDDTRHSRIVSHGQSESIRQAILELVAEPESVFSDNAELATERMAHFSKEQRLERWQTIERDVLAPRKTIYHFCALGRGGAAGATFNIHKGFLKAGWNSRFVTRRQEKGAMPKHAPNVIYVEPEFSFDFQQAQPNSSRPGQTIFSIDDHAISNETLLALVKDADAINLAWAARFLSVENIGMLSQTGIPILVTLRDMNPITGGCHYFHGCDKWMKDCSACPQVRDVSDDYPQLVLQAKLEIWNRNNVSFVSLSEHCVQILKNATLSRNFRVDKIHNYVDQSVFYRDESVSRTTVLGDVEGFVIGYLPSFNSEVKGHAEFVEALHILKERHPDIELTIAWITSGGDHEKDVPFDVVSLTPMHEKAELRAFYNAVDIVAVPSLEETFSNTTVEALACGSPVVGFQTGILAELPSTPKISGVVAMGDCGALAEEIAVFHRDGIDVQACLNYVQTHFSQEDIMSQYLALVESRIAERPKRPGDAEAPAAKKSLHELQRAMRGRKTRGARERLSVLRHRYGR